MEIEEAYTIQDQLRVANVMKQLHWDQTLANDLLITIDNIQLTLGYVRPFFEDTGNRLDYVDQGFPVSLQEHTQAIEALMWIKKHGPQTYNEKGTGTLLRFLSIGSQVPLPTN